MQGIKSKNMSQITANVIISVSIGLGLVAIGLLIGFVLSCNYWKKYYDTTLKIYKKK